VLCGTSHKRLNLRPCFCSLFPASLCLPQVSYLLRLHLSVLIQVTVTFSRCPQSLCLLCLFAGLNLTIQMQISITAPPLRPDTGHSYFLPWPRQSLYLCLFARLSPTIEMQLQITVTLSSSPLQPISSLSLKSDSLSHSSQVRECLSAYPGSGTLPTIHGFTYFSHPLFRIRIASFCCAHGSSCLSLSRQQRVDGSGEKATGPYHMCCCVGLSFNIHTVRAQVRTGESFLSTIMLYFRS
jgi:hypothetical protein